MDLFNRGYFWEAHEAWEAVWLSWPRNAGEARFVRGCIQTAAALLKLKLEVPGGVEKLSTRSLETLQNSDSEVVLGIRREMFVQALQQFWKDPNTSRYPRLAPGHPKNRGH